MNAINLTNTKIWVGNNPELWREIVKRANELGWKFSSGIDYSKYNKLTALYFNNDKTLSHSESESFFKGHNVKEIFPQDLEINIEITYEIY